MMRLGAPSASIFVERGIEDLGGTALQLSLQLQNRQRIWRLLEEAAS